MKKILAILFLSFLLINPASAIITNEEETSPEYMLHFGYSPEVVRLVDMQKASINGTKQTYFGEKPVRWVTKYKCVNFAIKYLLEQYVGTDDGKFGTHPIHTSTSYDDL